MTSSTSINDVKLAQNCQIVLEDISGKLSQTINRKIKTRRESVRLSHKILPNMKEARVRISKKHRNISQRASQRKLDAKQPNQGNDKSFDTTNCDDQLADNMSVLSNDVNDLITQIRSFIDNEDFEFGEHFNSIDELNSTTDYDLNLIELSTLTDVNQILNELICLDEIEINSKLDLSTNQVKSTHPKWQPNVVTVNVQKEYTEALDLSVNKRQSIDSELRPTANAQNELMGALDLSINKEKSTDPHVQPYVQAPCTSNAQKEFIGALDLSTNKVESAGTKCQPNIITADDFIKPAVANSTNLTAPANTTLACCSSNKIIKSNTVESISSKDCPNTVNSPPVFTKSSNKVSKAKKRQLNGQPRQENPCQIFIKNCNVQNCHISRFKIQMKKLPTEENNSKDLSNPSTSQNFFKIHSNPGQSNLTLSHDVSRKISAQPTKISTKMKPLDLHQRGMLRKEKRQQPITQMPMQAAIERLKPDSDIVEMQSKVFRLLDGPCFKFLRNEDCGPYCRYNHSLPCADVVAATMKDWSNELLHYFYLTCVQPNVMCYILYFSVVCNMFAERRLINTLLATVKDCERLSIEHYLNNIFMALTHCDISPDQSLLLVCTNSNRSLASIQVILEIMCSFHLNNFAHTAAFISSQIENYEISPTLANKILEKAYKDGPLNTVIRNFCIKMLRKSLSKTTTLKSMELCLMQILTRGYPHL